MITVKEGTASKTITVDFTLAALGGLHWWAVGRKETPAGEDLRVSEGWVGPYVTEEEADAAARNFLRRIVISVVDGPLRAV